MDEIRHQKAPIVQRLSTVVDLRVPGYLTSVPPGAVGQHVFANLDTIVWYRHFVDKLLSKLGKSHYPVFRVSDGEFYFSVGLRFPSAAGTNPVLHYLRRYAGALRVGRFPWRFRSGAPKYGWEQYSSLEWLRLRRKFAQHLVHIASNGVLAINFTVTPTPFAEPYFEPFCSWMDKNSISLSQSNYYPFYFVYALLNGPDKRAIYQAHRILIVSSFNEAKRASLNDALMNQGAKSVEFLPISRTKSLVDKLDLSKIATNIDVALVAAGVGASNILTQLQPLNTLLIDAGYCLEIMVDNSKRYNRVFCVPDDMNSVA